MSYRRKKRADDEAWGAPAARRRAPAPAHPVMDYNNWTRDLERDSAAGPAAPDPASRRGPGSSPPGDVAGAVADAGEQARGEARAHARPRARERALLERLKFDAPRRPRRPRTRRCPPSSPRGARRAHGRRLGRARGPRALGRRACARGGAAAPLRAKLVRALAEHAAPEAPPEEEEIPVLERMRRAAAERDEAARRRANAAAKKLSPKKKPALKKSASAPANLSPPKPGAARMGISGGALRVERKHRYARALEKPSGYDARRKATPPAPPELHLANHERLLKKYERSLVASNGLEGDRLCRIQIFNSTSIRIDLDLTELENSQVWSGPPKPVVEFGTGDRTPLAEDLTPYRALVSLAPEAFEMDPATGATGALRRRSFDDGPAAGEDAAALEARFREIMA
ncbi:peptide-aspartate beta-dioxygenase [Aureococcus anophagefferens]|nr:peptide-aspartate beta-dioxygenase [Aureococcus anophagefferens]